MPSMLRSALLVSVVALCACKKDQPAAADAAPPQAAASGVSQQDVKRIVRDAKPAMEACAQKASSAPSFTGKITLFFSVNPNGNVDKKRLGLGGAEGLDDFAKCVLDIVAALKFPAASAPTDVQMPVDLGKHADAGVVPDARAD